MVDTLNPPLSVILSWPKPNYIDPTDRGPALFICCILFSIFGVFQVSARIYSRVFLTRAPGSDDILIVLGLLLTVTLSGLIAYGNKHYYTGRHIWDIPLTVWTPNSLNVWICEWIYLAASACIKISILLFYRRLGVSFSKGFRIAVWFGIAYNILVWLGFVIALLVICQPMVSYWKRYDFLWAAEHKFYCGSEQVSLPLSGGLSMLGDLYATILPMFMISMTVQSRRQRMGLYALFGVGFLSVVSGTIRTYLMHRIISVDYDFTGPLYYMWIATIVELYVGIFAASAPALKPFFKQYVIVPMSKAKSSGTRSTTAKSPGPWSANAHAPWSHSSSKRESGHLDIEKVGIAQGFPEKIQPGTHTTWVELQSTDNGNSKPQVEHRRYSRMISFPEERTPSIDEIAIAR